MHCIALLALYPFALPKPCLQGFGLHLGANPGRHLLQGVGQRAEDEAALHLRPLWVRGSLQSDTASEQEVFTVRRQVWQWVCAAAAVTEGLPQEHSGWRRGMRAPEHFVECGMGASSQLEKTT